MDRTRSTPFVQLTVNFEIREDGGLRVFSDDLPELVLSHRDAQAVLKDIEPALEMILSAKLGRSVEVRPLVDLQEILQQAIEDSATNMLPAHLCGGRRYAAHCN